MNVNPEHIQKLINNMKYPVRTSELPEMARQRGASDQIIALLEKLPDRTFNSPEEVQQALSKHMGGVKA